jgi:hypothetical protein
MRDSGGAQRALPVAANAQDGTVGEARVHPHFASAAGDAAADVPIRDAAPHQPRDAASGLLPLPANGPLAGRAHLRGPAEAAVQSALPQRGIVLVPQVSREQRKSPLSISISRCPFARPLGAFSRRFGPSIKYKHKTFSYFPQPIAQANGACRSLRPTCVFI